MKAPPPRVLLIASALLVISEGRATAGPQEKLAAGREVEPGSVLLASAEGLSVFTRDGAMQFGHFNSSSKGAPPGPVPYDDVVYDAWRLPSGNYLYSSHRYVRESDPDGRTVWEFQLSAPSELKSCVPLPNGDVMTVDADRMELVQVTDRGRREVRRIPVPTAKDAAPHVRYNLLRRTSGGTFLLALRHEKAFVEVNESGKELWRHEVPDLPVVAERLVGGNTLMSWRSGLLEVTPDHRVVWELKASELPDFPVLIFGGFHRFADGNTLVANSDWHYPDAGKNRVQLFEVTRDKRVVWKLTTDAFAGRKPGSLEPRTGLIEHRVTGLQWLSGWPEKPRAEDAFFETAVQPLLVERCYECHSHEKKIKGGLALDSASGWKNGGEGGPVVVPGSPERSRLILAVRYADPDLKMPPKKKLSDAEVEVLVDWIRRGAPGPRHPLEGADLAAKRAGQQWELLYRDRLSWWSLQPISRPEPPRIKDVSWSRNPVDAFILEGLETRGLRPVAEADRRTLARRLSFALTGLPPAPEEAERFARSDSPRAYEDYVEALLARPQFGEHWARHWMDVVHYADTHGYEWDVPAKNAWMYRDYLIRAFNGDLSFQRFALEQFAGDLLEPRVDSASGLNESVIGPMSMLLGERRHGDNADVEGITQEAISNIIDTTSKAWIATTVACAQCHDHKLDAVGQRDYYGLAGILMSTRWPARTCDALDPNLEVLRELRELKAALRQELSRQWLGSRTALGRSILSEPAKATSKDGFPTSASGIWSRLAASGTEAGAVASAWARLEDEFQRQRRNAMTANQADLTLLADFTKGDLPAGWQADGLGMKHGLVRDGELVVGEGGGGSPLELLPAGRWSHVWSPRLAGALRGPLLDSVNPVTFSLGYAGGRQAAYSLIVDNALHSERMKFIEQPEHAWLRLTSGGFVRVAGSVDRAARRVYLELVTQALNNNFPPRTGYDGLKESDLKDERSWFGVTRAYRHAPGKAPKDELGRFAPLFAGGRAAPSSREEVAGRLADLLMAAVDRFSRDACDSEDVRLINDAIRAKWLLENSPTLSSGLAKYRDAEKRLRPDRVIGSAAEFNEGRDEPIGIRGSYTEFGEGVPRGNIRFLGGAAVRAVPASSGRLEWARNIADERNPLTSRVYVNRVWHYLFGHGLVRTVDDFGHLGEKPSHPELLDWLATWFMKEGWSTKKLVRLLVTSATWRQQSIVDRASALADPENRLWHHYPMRRLDAEAIRDSLLAVSGRLEGTLYGPPVDPPRASEDAAKRLRSGPLDGDGRRSVYLRMTLMEPPKFLALFNQPIPKLTVGQRDSTSVPDQALALLNDPFVIALAKHWSERVLQDGAESPEPRVRRMFERAFSRPPGEAELAGLVKLARRSAELRAVDAARVMASPLVWQDLAHALFNLKEFIYVR